MYQLRQELGDLPEEQQGNDDRDPSEYHAEMLKHRGSCRGRAEPLQRLDELGERFQKGFLPGGCQDRTAHESYSETLLSMKPGFVRYR